MQSSSLPMAGGLRLQARTPAPCHVPGCVHSGLVSDACGDDIDRLVWIDVRSTLHLFSRPTD